MEEVTLKLLLPPRERRRGSKGGHGEQPELLYPLREATSTSSSVIAPLLLPRDIFPSRVTLKQARPLLTPMAISVLQEAEGLGRASPPHTARREISN